PPRAHDKHRRRGLVLPYPPIDRTSPAVCSGSPSRPNLPPYATCVVPYAFAHLSETAVPDPVSRGLYNQMIDPRLGTWTAGRFTPARPGRHRLSAQFVIYKQSSQGQLRSEEHTSELQSRENLVCRLLLEKKNLH